MTKLKDSRKVNYLFGIGDFMRIGGWVKFIFPSRKTSN